MSESFLLLGLKTRSEKTWPDGPVPRGEVALGPLVFRGPKTGGRILTREWAASASLVGPGSPDAACFERTWDPVEDALALGWPALTGRLTAVGETWRGALNRQQIFTIADLLVAGSRLKSSAELAALVGVER